MPRAGDGARSGAFVAAVWLIGIGVVFLVQQGMGWSWGEAWPLFIILVGVGSLASLVVAPPRGTAGFVAAVGWPLFVTAAGVLLLLSTTGNLGMDPGELIGYWPIAAIAGGLWLLVAAVLPSSRAGDEQLSVPLGGATNATVRLRFGGGELTVARSAPGTLVDGEFRGGVRSRSRGSGSVELEPPSGMPFGWWNEWPRWTMGVTGDVPLDLELEGGASKTLLDLSETQLRSLRLKTGASETRVRLPRAAGLTSVHAEAGAASVVFEVPSGVAVRVRSQMSLGSTHVDARIPRAGDGWESPEFASAENRVELDVRGGVGSLQVVSVG
jgi:hypothetical protein